MPAQPPVEAFEHDDHRVNIPTADAHDLVDDAVHAPKILLVERDTGLDPQLVWTGKDAQDPTLEVAAPPLWIQEKVDPRAIIEDLKRSSRRSASAGDGEPSLFDGFEDFDGLDGFESVDYYRHQANWSNRMILGDSLEVMASLAEREDLRGQVQCIYIDPPYGIKFNSNWQVSTSKRDVKDKVSDATREVEQIKAFRDTWELGIHSYLSYLRDRLQVAHSLLTDSGSVFVQIGDENVHLVRSLLDEVFGRENFVSQIAFQTTTGASSPAAKTVTLATVSDQIVWYAKDSRHLKYRQLWTPGQKKESSGYRWLALPDGSRRGMTAAEMSGQAKRPEGSKVYKPDNIQSSGSAGEQPFHYQGRTYRPGANAHWKASLAGMERLALANRIHVAKNSIQYVRYVDDFGYQPIHNVWTDVGTGNFTDDKLYVVQTGTKVVERCLLMATDPGDLVLDPTCGSGTTAYVAEQWGRRWITVDTSRVALALARQRLMAARFPYYVLADSVLGRRQRVAPSCDSSHSDGELRPPRNEVRQGFVYSTAQRITLGSISRNPELREGMTTVEIDESVARHAEVETLYDRPHEDASKVRVAGRFTVESLSPHRSLSFGTDVSDETTHNSLPTGDPSTAAPTFERTILDNLVAAGVQNGRKSERLAFEELEPYPGIVIQAVGTRAGAEDGTPQRVAVAIGPEYGTVDARFVKAAAREALKGAGFDILLVLGFSFAANALQTAGEFAPSQAAEPGEFAVVADEKQFGKLPVLLVRMNTDLAMGSDLLKKTGAGNLFTIFGEPDVAVEATADGVVVEIRGIDVYDPTTGQIRVDAPDTIALWMIDTEYDGESFFVRHAYFSGGNDPYGRLKKALKAEIDESAWATLYSTRSRPFPYPSTGRIAVKAINDYGDEVLTVIDVDPSLAGKIAGQRSQGVESLQKEVGKGVEARALRGGASLPLAPPIQATAGVDPSETADVSAAEVRAWAKAKGFPVGDRGRLDRILFDTYRRERE